jgi:hypothetical protein
MTMDIIRAFHDRKLLGYGVQDFSSFKNWEVCQRAIYGLPLISDEQREIYTRYTHRTDFDAPQACKEAVLVNGRRSGKSFMMAVSAVHGALFKFGGKKPFLRRGEKLTIKVLAQDREAARTSCVTLRAFWRRRFSNRKLSRPPRTPSNLPMM